MSGRLAVAIITTLLWEATLVAVMLWGLPQMGVEIPPSGLIVLMLLLAGFAIFTYHMGSRALDRKPVASLSSMVSTRGKVVRPIEREGMVKIKGELWVAKSSNGRLDIGEDVVVTERDGLKLTVRKEAPEGEPKRGAISPDTRGVSR